MSQDQNTPPARRGRPPSRAARAKALSAAHEILMNEGLGRLSIEAVAAQSGVGKPTIYRHWANASELAMEALMAGFPSSEGPERAGLHAKLEGQIGALVRAFSATRGRQIAMALATADPESEFTRAFRNRVILSSREAGRGFVEAAVASGEIADPADIEVVLDMIYAPLLYRLLAGHQPLDADLARAVAAGAMRLLGEPA